MLTPEEQAELDGLLQRFPDLHSGNEAPSLMGRIGRQAVNLVPSIAQGLTNSAIGVANVTRDSDDQFAPANFLPYDIPQAQGFGEKAVDTVAGLVSTVGQALIPGGAAAKAARMAGLMRAAPIIGDVAAGAALGLQQSPTEGAGTAAEFGAIGAANRFIGNPLLKAAANIAVPVAGQLLRGHDPLSTDSLIATGTNVAVPALLGRFAREPVARTTEAPPPTPEPLRLFDRRIETGWTPPEFREQPSKPLLLRNGPEAGEIEGNQILGGYTEPAAREGMSADRRPLLIGEPPEGFVPPEPKRLLLRDAEETLPESQGMQMRGDQGGYIDVRNPLIQTLSGAAAGAVIDPLIDDDPDKPTWQKFGEGALRGAGAALSLRGLAMTPQITRQLLSRQSRAVNEGLAAEGRPIMAQEGQTLGAVPFSGMLQKGKDLLRRATNEEERGNPSALGKFGRVLEREFGAGKSDLVTHAEELGKGEVQVAVTRSNPLLKTLGTATPAETKELLRYDESQRTPQDMALLRSTVRPEIVNAVETGEKLEGGLQDLIGRASGDAEKQALLSATRGTYRTTKYAAFTDPSKWTEMQKADPALRQKYVDQIVADNELPGFSKMDVAQAVDEYAAGIRRGENFAQMSAGNSKINRNLFTARKDLSPEHKAFLGEYTDPRQRLAFTLQKLINSAAQAKKIETLSQFGARGDLDIMTRQERQAKMKAATAAGDTATMDRLANLAAIDNPAFGTLHGKLVSRDVLDSLNAHNQLWTGGWLKSSFFSAPTHVIKGALTIGNPATHVRQWLQTPMTAAIARVAPWDLLSAGRIIGAKGAEHEELLRNHIIGADFSAQDLARGAQKLDTAYNPNSAAGRVRGAAGKAWDAMKGAYGLPDNLVRAAAYFKHKPRFFAEGAAKGLKGAELEAYAQEKATMFTNRYTMNYGAVANAVKVARETPFISPFLSYQAEMTRILKNLGEDAISGSGSDRAWAIGNIAALVAAPILLEKAAVAALGDKDQDDWQKASKLSPDYASGQIRIPLSRDKNGAFRYINLANFVPAGDFSALARNLASGDTSAFSQSPVIGWDKSPVLNLAAEMVTGRDRVTQEKIDTNPKRLLQIAKNFAPPLTPFIGNDAKRIAQGFTRNDQGGLGIENGRTGRSETPATALGRIGGLSINTVQPKTLLKRAAFDRQEAISTANRDLKQILQTNAAPEAKAQARQKFLLRKREAQEKYRDLIGR